MHVATPKFQEERKINCQKDNKPVKYVLNHLCKLYNILRVLFFAVLHEKIKISNCYNRKKEKDKP